MLFRKSHLLLTALLMILLCSCSDSDSDSIFDEPEFPITSIEIAPGAIALSEGESYDLSVTITPDDASEARISWESSDPNVAKVVNGIVTGVSEGTTTITATAGQRQAMCDVTVFNSWINPVFAKALQQSGYISDAATVTPSDVKDLTEINLSGTDSNPGTLTSLKGIEYFTSLKLLRCNMNQIASLDLSKNTKLEQLDCYENRLTSLDVTKNTALKLLLCRNNRLTSLDVSKNSQLMSLTCSDNQLTSLDVSKNVALSYLDCGSNLLTSLDLSNNTALSSLSCYSNKLTSLDVSKHRALKVLFCGDNQLTSLDVTNNTLLMFLLCQTNKLTSLDISRNTSLNVFECYDNPGSNGQFRVKAWFDNNSVPTDITLDPDYKSSWTYNGSTVSIYYYK